MEKPKIGLYWCSSCGGCEESVVDLAENILTVVGAVDIVFWPVAMDFKYKDVENLDDGELACVLINGAVRMSEQEEIVKLLRKKAKIVVAHGSCAHLGGIVGLGNFYKKEQIIDTAFKKVPTISNPKETTPQLETEEGGSHLTLPEFYDNVKPLNQVIDVDYYLPGCPPPADLVFAAVGAVLENKLPPKGSVIGESKSLCDTCSRRDSKPENLNITEFKRVYEVELDPEKCLLEQGIICLGPVTRGGCQERCLKANMPCRGCFGPLDNVMDQGAKFLSMLAASIGETDEEKLQKIIDSIADPAGLFYRYSLAASSLKGRK